MDKMQHAEHMAKMKDGLMQVQSIINSLLGEEEMEEKAEGTENETEGAQGEPMDSATGNKMSLGAKMARMMEGK